MNRRLILGLLLVVAAALVLRLPQLDRRPLHTDESVHAIKFLGLWERGFYRYDPHEYHGPFLYYATLPFAWLSGARSSAALSETTLRLVPVCFGIGLILFLPLLRDGLGMTAIFASGLFTALSPMMVFYSRYYIHELVLVCCTMLLFGATWRYLQTRRLWWALLAGATLGLMHATKETFIFVLVAATGALVMIWRWGPSPVVSKVNTAHSKATCWRDGLLALLMAITVSVLFFSSFFTNARGLLDSVLTYAPWFSRAGGNSPHNHPWYFYLERLAWFHPAKGPVWTEALILALALVGFIASFRRSLPAAINPFLARFFAVFTLLLTAIYCLLPYKTPWCALGFYHGMILLAGIGFAWLCQQPRKRWIAIATASILPVGLGQLGLLSWQSAFPYAADQRNPWVYAHTSNDFVRLVERVNAIAQVAPDPLSTVIKVMAPGGDYWPLPWYLRGYKNVGWWGQVPQDPYGPIMIVGSKFEANLDEKSEKKWLMVGLFEHRPKVFFELYVELDLWKKYIASLPPPRDDD